jgi:hypothetical protein
MVAIDINIPTPLEKERKVISFRLSSYIQFRKADFNTSVCMIEEIDLGDIS